MINEELNQLHEVLLKIMQQVHCFCIENNIEYSLMYGSALGAIRHKGFIPWDDDFDIAMSYDSYKKFVFHWNEKAPSNLYLQDINDKSKINHIKIRLDNTLFISSEEEKNEFHNGIWIDIFPLFKVKNDKRSYKYIKKWNAIRLLYTRKKHSTKDGIVLKIGSFLLTKCVPQFLQKKLLSIANKNILKFNNLLDNFSYINLSTLSDMNKLIDNKIFNVLNEVKFENTTFLMSNIIESDLYNYYGDFMKFPPKEEQVCKHNPIELKFGD